MKSNPQKLLCFLAAFSLVTACQKKSTDVSLPPRSINTETAVPGSIRVKLTPEEQEMLSSLLVKEGVKDSVDFLNKIHYVQSQNLKTHNLVTKTTSTAADAGYYEAEEEQNIGGFYTSTVSEIDQQYDGDQLFLPEYYPEYLRQFRQVATRVEQFAIRGNQIMYTIPYIVAFLKSSGRIVGIGPMPGSPPRLDPVGPYWGTYTASPSPAYLQRLNAQSASVYAQGSEVRTVVTSVTGSVKLSTTADISVFKVGAELGAGFTIQSASNTYNQYTLSGTITLQMLYPGTNGDMPIINCASALKCQQYGILRNE